MSEVYARYVDTAGNYHYSDTETGHHVIRKSCGYCHEDSNGYGRLMYRKFVQDEVLDNGIIKGHMELIKTNADRIRSMTDEELASVITDDWCEIVCGGTDYLCEGTCEQHVLKWLKGEAKG